MKLLFFWHFTVCLRCGGLLFLAQLWKFCCWSYSCHSQEERRKSEKTFVHHRPFWRSKHILRWNGKLQTTNYELRQQNPSEVRLSRMPRCPEPEPSYSDSTPQAEPKALTSAAAQPLQSQCASHHEPKTNRTTLCPIKQWTGKNLLTGTGKNSECFSSHSRRLLWTQLVD